MAKKGEMRPDHKTKIGAALCRYIGGRHKYHDPVFTREIKRLAPDWFVSPLTRKKKSLLEMAERGEPRPSRTTKIGIALCSYTMESCVCYDAAFDRKIRRMRPDWFVPMSEKVGEKKRLLLEMAKRGEPKPLFKNPIRHCLHSYTKKTSGCYDPDFTRQIKKLAPDWFLTGPERNKRRFLEMAKRKEPRPKRKTMFILYHYIRKASPCHDPKFTREIMRLAPHWFKKKAL